MPGPKSIGAVITPTLLLSGSRGSLAEASVGLHVASGLRSRPGPQRLLRHVELLQQTTQRFAVWVVLGK